MRKLRLIASDTQDLSVMAAAVQDAIVNIGGIHFDAAARALTLRMTRFRHEEASGKNKGQRVEAGLRIDGVLALQSRGIDRENPDSFAVILDMSFEPSDNPAEDPSGYLSLLLAGGGELRANVEALDLILADTDNARMTKAMPSHDI